MGAYIVIKGEHENQETIAVARAYTVGMAGELNLFMGEGHDDISITGPFVSPFERYGMTLAPGQWGAVFWDENEEVV